jgi:Starch-binding associating with outer membrane
MKRFQKLYKMLILLPFAFVLGCDDFLDVNESPNAPEKVPVSLLLPSGLVGSAFANANELNRFASTTMDYLYGAAGGPAAWDIYNTDGANFGNQWRFEIYGGALTIYESIINSTEAPNASSYVGIAKIMKAYTYSIATDTWGDVPYSEALKGEANTQPRLDSQEDIYKGNAALGIQSLFDLVREGIASLNAASTINPTASSDVVYAGDVARWRRAGYTLMLKMALQISDREPALATSVINEVIAANDYIVTNAQNLSVNFGGGVGSQSPIYTYNNVSLFQNDIMASTSYINLLNSLNDPRLPIFITAPTGSYVTYQNGFTGTLAPVANRSKWSAAITGANGVGPVKLITNAQRTFILAEAALILPGVTLPAGQTPQTLFEEGIRASMTLAGVTAGNINAYFAANPAVVTLAGTVEQQRAQIITQKYIAGTGNGLEAWNDYRRTGYPAFAEHLNAVGIDGKRPRRAQYINEEVQRNPNFTPVVLPNVNVWWDVN